MLSMTSRNRSHRRDSFADSGSFDRPEYARSQSRSQSPAATFDWRDSLPADIVKASDLASINSKYEFDLSINSSTRFTVANGDLPPSIADLTATCAEGEFAAEIDFQAKYSEQKSVMSYDEAAGQLNASVSKTDSAWSWQHSLSGSLGTSEETISFSSQSTYSAQTASWTLDLPQIGTAAQYPCPTPESGLQCVEPTTETTDLSPSQESRFTITAESISNTYQVHQQSDRFNTSITMLSSQSITSWQTNQPLPPPSDPTLISPCDRFPSLDFQSVSRTETLSMSKGIEARIDLNFQAFSETRLTKFAAAGDFGKQTVGLLQQNSQLGLAAFG